MTIVYTQQIITSKSYDMYGLKGPWTRLVDLETNQFLFNCRFIFASR